MKSFMHIVMSSMEAHNLHWMFRSAGSDVNMLLQARGIRTLFHDTKK